MKLCSIENITVYFLSILFFLLLIPYFVWHTPLIRHTVEVLFVFGCIPYLDKRPNSNKIILSIILLLLIAFLVRETSLTGIISNVFLLLIFNLTDNIKVKLFQGVLNVFAFVMGISILVYILVCWLSVPLPHQIIEPLNPVKETYYLQYPFLVVYNSAYNFGNMRFYSVFDEPGVVGTIAAIFLCGNNYKINSIQYVIICIAGLLSFSFFFIVISAVCLLRKSHMKYIVYCILAIIILYCIFHSFFEHNKELFDKLIFSRFTAEGNYGGNRVGALFNQKYHEFLWSNDVFLGRGSEELNKILSGGSSYKSLIYSNGIIWFCTMCIFFVINIFTICKNNKNIFYSILIFLGVLYQRPNVFDLPYFFMFITLPLVLQQKYESRFSVNSVS